MNYTKIVPFIASGLLCLVSSPARAGEWNQKTTFTFNEPVEIPGQVLAAGTYVFKLADSNSDRDIVEVFNKNEDHLIGLFMAIPDYRLRPTGKTLITFEERAAHAPEAVKAWFYPGDNYGHEFVYPKTRAAELAKANNQPVPSMPDELSVNTTQPVKSMLEPPVVAMKKAPLKAEEPNGSELTVIEVFPAAPAR